MVTLVAGAAWGGAMQRVLGGQVWTAIRTASATARSRKLAVAYVTRDLVGLEAGDLLLVDASRRAIASGETDAPLLRTLLERGVVLYDCAALHAKVMLLGNIAVIGSGNMSSSSERLVEAAVMTDSPTTVSAVASLIEQLRRQSTRLTAARVAALCAIPVVRRGGAGVVPRTKRAAIGELGNRTWIVGVYELSSSAEETAIERGKARLRRAHGDAEEDFDAMTFGRKVSFARLARAGDSVIEIWRPNLSSPRPRVYPARPILLKDESDDRRVRLFLPQPAPDSADIGWGAFQRLLTTLGYRRRITKDSMRLIESDLADAIGRQWGRR